jgi:hypothetical protein
MYVFAAARTGTRHRSGNEQRTGHTCTGVRKQHQAEQHAASAPSTQPSGRITPPAPLQNMRAHAFHTHPALAFTKITTIQYNKQLLLELEDMRARGVETQGALSFAQAAERGGV